jgi:signal peptide peptidase SppA
MGPLDHHDSGWGFDSYEAILERIQDALSGQDIVQAAERKRSWGFDIEIPAPIPAKALVLCIDSPGGEAAGASQLHRRIVALRKETGIPVFAYVNETACSAGYEIASACDQVWLSDCGVVGSIGVIATLFDRTVQNAMIGLGIELVTSGKYKADGHPDRPLTDGVRSRTQARVNQLADVFFELVAEARGTTPESVAALEADIFIGQNAVTAGLADGVCDLVAFMSQVTSYVASPAIAAE